MDSCQHRSTVSRVTRVNLPIRDVHDDGRRSAERAIDAAGCEFHIAIEERFGDGLMGIGVEIGLLKEELGSNQDRARGVTIVSAQETTKRALVICSSGYNHRSESAAPSLEVKVSARKLNTWRQAQERENEMLVCFDFGFVIRFCLRMLQGVVGNKAS